MSTKKEILGAIREKCLDCCLDQTVEVKLCTAERCPIWPFRLGKDPFKSQREMSPAQIAVLQAARDKRDANRAEKLSMNSHSDF